MEEEEEVVVVVSSAFDLLLAPFEGLLPGEVLPRALVRVQGRIVVKRLMGRRLAFFELQSLGPDESQTTTHVMQLCVAFEDWKGFLPSPPPPPSPDTAPLLVGQQREQVGAMDRSFRTVTALKQGDVVSAFTSLLCSAPSAPTTLPAFFSGQLQRGSPREPRQARSPSL